MKLLYEAPTSVEAYMILNLLKQAGLSGRIDGEYLQGGVGELPAINIVRVMVEEAIYSEAKSIIDEWESQTVKAIPDAPKTKSSLGQAVLGFIIGIIIMATYYNTPVTDDGVDYNGDGILDEIWTYTNYLISKLESDTNFDGWIDYQTLFDRKGLAKSSSYDADFDGSFETDISYVNGIFDIEESDTTGDGFKDYRIKYKHDKIETITFVNPLSGLPIKVQEYGHFKLQRAHFDSNQDGILDTIYEYDANEEIINTIQNE